MDAKNSFVNFIILEKQHETKTDFCNFLGINRLFDEHGMNIVFELWARLPRTTTREGWISLELDGLPLPPSPDPDALVLSHGSYNIAIII